MEQGTISGSIAKEVFAKMFDSGRDAEEIVAAEGLAQIGDEDTVLAIVREVIAEHADAVAEYRAGKQTDVRVPGRPGDERQWRQGRPRRS